MRTIAFSNRKGGCGKSSCVLHLGIRFAQMGYRVLLVDADPQASLSQGLLGREALDLDPSETLAGLYDYAGLPMAGLIRAGGRDGLAIVPAHERMDHHNMPDPWETGSTQFALREGLAEVAADYDLALLDSPPHIGVFGWSTLAAADAVVIPAQLEDFSIQGVGAVVATIGQVQAVANPDLRLLGILGTMVDKRIGIHSSYAITAREVYGDDLFAEVIPAAADFKVATTMRQGITEFKPRGDASKALVRVGAEVLARLDARCGGIVEIEHAGRGVA